MHLSFRRTCSTMLLGYTLLLLTTLATAAEPTQQNSAAPVPSTAPAAKAPPAASAPEPATLPSPVPDSKKAAEPSAPSVAAPPSVRIGYVDMVRVGQESKQGKSAQAKLKTKKDKFQSQISAKQKQLEKQRASLEEKLPSMTPAERATKAKEFEKKVEDYRKLVLKAEGEMKPLQEELTRTLFDQIEQAAATYGKANGFTAIVTQKDLLYLGGGISPEDVTDAVLKQMETQQGSSR